jgi:hypothetical protein
MAFDPQAYGSEVAAILGGRAMPKGADPHRLFPHARSAEGAMAGLYLHCGCWDEAHEIAQNVETPEGSYWHAIVHRQEPDAANSAYWYRQVGEHPIFPALAKLAGVARWDPYEFIQQCERGEPGTAELQRAEWELLFDYCAR